jgi:hypothetical protein
MEVYLRKNVSLSDSATINTVTKYRCIVVSSVVQNIRNYRSENFIRTTIRIPHLTTTCKDTYMATGQRTRTPKTSAGVHGSGGKGRPLTGIEKINIGNNTGLLRNVARRWKESK